MTSIVLASSFPDALNRNAAILTSLNIAFRALLGHDASVVAPFEALEAAVTLNRPDLVLLVGSLLPQSCDFRGVQRACIRNNVVLAYWNVEDPYEFDANYKMSGVADHVFTSDGWAVNFYDSDAVSHLPLAGCRATHFRPFRPFRDRRIEVFFCGVGYPVRRRLVADLGDFLRDHDSYVCGSGWDGLAGLAANRRLEPAELLEYYTQSKLVLNIGRDYSLANDYRMLVSQTPGPRTFEAALAGCVQFFHLETFEIERYFAPGTEILPFDRVRDLTEAADALLADPETYERIGRAAQARALRDHTYEARIQTMLQRLVDVKLLEDTLEATEPPAEAAPAS